MEWSHIIVTFPQSAVADLLSKNVEREVSMGGPFFFLFFRKKKVMWPFEIPRNLWTNNSGGLPPPLPPRSSLGRRHHK